MTTVYDGFYLLDHHRNRDKPTGGAAGEPDTRPWYTTRQKIVTAIVIHTPETLEDFTAPYDEADRVAEYGATTTRASWHATIDADSIIPMLPSSYTAWQVRGYNSHTIGYEIGAKATSWEKAPADWVTGVLTNAAAYARVDAAIYGIPARLLTRAQVDAGQRGFVGHAPLDPTRRTDPGADFPWNRFLNLVKGDDEMTITQARIEVAAAWYAKAGVWMDGASGEDPQERLTRLAKAVAANERTVSEIVQFVGRVRNPPPGEAVPAWVLDPTTPYAAPIYGGGATTTHQHDARYVRRGDHTIRL